MGAATVETPTALLDLAMKSGLRFSLRAHGNGGSGLSETEREAAEHRGPNGEKILGAWEGGRPILGLLHPKRRQLDAEDIARQIKQLSAWPACWPRCQTSDDFSVYYGWDYSDLAKRTFKEKTGLDAPAPPEMAKLHERFQDAAGSIDRPKGVVPENDPWLQWTAFATRDIAGGYNKALTEASVKATPNAKIGPVPGGMQIPLCLQGQYPPHHFGVNGFNLLYYYYYLVYWQPEIGNVYWDEVARMNNRDLELWTEPDCTTCTEPTYYRNTFFLHLAGGCQGLTYYSYGEALPEAWKELSRLGNHVVRPLYPFLGKLRPTPTKAGLLLPYTQFAHAVYYPTSALYAYANLLGHIWTCSQPVRRKSSRAISETTKPCCSGTWSGCVRVWSRRWKTTSAREASSWPTVPPRFPSRARSSCPSIWPWAMRRVNPAQTIRGKAGQASRTISTRTGWPASARR